MRWQKPRPCTTENVARKIILIAKATSAIIISKFTTLSPTKLAAVRQPTNYSGSHNQNKQINIKVSKWKLMKKSKQNVHVILGWYAL
jgi:hypothetical protein